MDAAQEIAIIQDWHGHIYYDPKTTREAAEALRTQLAELFPDAVLGRWHDTQVGPHTEPMYQVLFPVSLYPSIVPWLALHRRGLAVLIHPNTGRQRADHVVHAMWLGAMLPLKAEILPE